MKALELSVLLDDIFASASDKGLPVGELKLVIGLKSPGVVAGFSPVKACAELSFKEAVAYKTADTLYLEFETKEKLFEKDKGEMLYTKWAARHLKEVDKSIEALTRFSNSNLLELVQALVNERDKLIATNKAYKHAAEILVSVGAIKNVPAAFQATENDIAVDEEQ